MTDQEPKWNAASLEVALAVRFAAPEFAFLPQARNCTGYGRRVRTADAVALGLYPSRGLHLHGFEIKVSRSDWLAEKKDPEKAEAIQQYCDFWWLVVSDPKILQPGELPLNWGLMAPRGKGLAAIKEPTINANPKVLDRQFFAGLLRKASEVVVDDAKLKAAVRKASDEGYERGKQSQEYTITNLKQNAQNLRTQIDNFERLSGIKITDMWGGGDLGRYVSIAQKHDWQHYRNRLGQARLNLLNLADEMAATIQGTRNGEMVDWMI